jgi:mannose-1-phosphate guanylyltransferase
MATRQRTWAVVLAAGDGTRLAHLTRDARGNAVPKQFCSLNGGASLLQEAMHRARRLVPRERLCVIVAEQHRRWWGPTLWSLPASNIVVQPRNCGTANGILLATLSILERDPLARIVFLPADHYVRDEAALAGSLREAATLLTREGDGLLLVGIEPEAADAELGYIVPGARDTDGSQRVARFVEKPDLVSARALIEAGALWNSFIFAARGPALLGLMRERMPEIVDRMSTALARDARLGSGGRALRELYAELSIVDFSRTVAQGAEDAMRVITAPACGWSDLGTPQRVAETLRRIGEERLERPPAPTRLPPFVTGPAFVDLSAQHARLAFA